MVTICIIIVIVIIVKDHDGSARSPLDAGNNALALAPCSCRPDKSTPHHHQHNTTHNKTTKSTTLKQRSRANTGKTSLSPSPEVRLSLGPLEDEVLQARAEHGGGRQGAQGAVDHHEGSEAGGDGQEDPHEGADLEQRPHEDHHHVDAVLGERRDVLPDALVRVVDLLFSRRDGRRG